MPWYRSLHLPLLVGSLVLVTGALGWSSAPPSPKAPSASLSSADSPPPPPLAPVTDPAAGRCLQLVLANLTAERLQWLEADVWQRVDLPDFAYEARGTYRLAPGHRFRLEMQTGFGGAGGTLLAVSDGENLWQTMRIGAGDWSRITRLGMKDVLATLDGPAATPRLRDEFFQSRTFTGVVPLVRNLAWRLTWVRLDAIRRDGRESHRLTGVWPAETVAVLAPGDQPWPAGLPRQCRLEVNPRTLWPERLEWWGPAREAGPDVLVAQMEFRTPVFNVPRSPEQCARDFHFDPAGRAVADQTGTITTHLAARALQLSSAPAP
jgi:hypothetical protein